MLKDYWRNRLNSADKQVYDMCVAAFSRKSGRVSCGDVHPDQLNLIYTSICNDHPEFYQLPSTVQFRQVRSLFSCNTEIIAENLFSGSTIRRYENEWMTLRNKISSQINSVRSEVEKERIICEYLVNNTKYEINNKFNQNAATVLFEHKGQCSGIAKATKMLFDCFGIECMIVTGEADDSNTGRMGPHSWNIVEINGKTYHLDVTFMIGANPTKGSSVNLAYFNYSDNEIRSNHAWDRTLTPKCGSDFSADKNVISNDNLLYISSILDLKSRLKSAITVGKKELAFMSKLPVGDSELLRTVQNCCQEVMALIHKALEISISITGKSVRLTWE